MQAQTEQQNATKHQERNGNVMFVVFVVAAAAAAE